MNTSVWAGMVGLACTVLPGLARAQTPCEYANFIPATRRSLDALNLSGRGLAGCEGDFHREQRDDFGVRQSDWDEGWGWDRANDDYASPYCLLMTGLRILDQDYATLPGDHPLNASDDFVETTAPRIAPACSEGAYAARAIGTVATIDEVRWLAGIVTGGASEVVFDNQDVYIELYRAVWEGDPVWRAGLLVHETTHLTGRPHLHSGCRRKLSCDGNYLDGDANSREFAYIREIAEWTPDSSTWIGNHDRLEAIYQANNLLWGAWVEDPGFRYSATIVQRLIDGLPPVVDTNELLATICYAGPAPVCTSESSEASLVIDSCWLTAFGGAFTGSEDSVLIDEVGGHATILSTSDGGDVNHFTRGVMGCRAGGAPVVTDIVVEVGAEHEKVIDLDTSIGRVCYLMGITGDLDNGDTASVQIEGGRWVARVFSNFGNGSGLRARFGCADGERLDSYSLAGSDSLEAALWQTAAAERIFCALTEVRNDFAGRDERAELSPPLDETQRWEFRTTSNRPFDFGGDIGAKAICFR